MSFSFIQYDPHVSKGTSQDLEKHRPKIVELYKTKKLKEIMQIMERDGLKARYVLLKDLPAFVPQVHCFIDLPANETC